MSRPNRIFVEGGVYHVYNRLGRGARVFDQETEAAAFVELLRDVVERDGLTVFAWTLMSNHFHLAVRTGVISLDRPMRSLQQRVTRGVNLRRRVYGPLWQGRYRAKLVEDQRFSLKVKDLARQLRKSPDGMTQTIARAARRRTKDKAFRRDLNKLDRALAEAEE